MTARDTLTDEKFTPTYEEKLICEYLRKLKMPAMAKTYEEQISKHNIDLTPFTARFKEIVEAEIDQRKTTKLNKLIKAAGLTYPDARFDDSIYNADRMLDSTSVEHLKTCQWIDEGRKLLITGKTGSGKTYLSNALCIAAMEMGNTVRYYRARDLMYEMKQAVAADKYKEKLKSLKKVDLIVIDDFGLMPLVADMCRYLFDVIDDREVMHASTIIISQLPVSSWFDIFSNDTYADACLSRLTDNHNSLRLEMNGKNMREVK